MGSKLVEARRWECDGCGKTALTEGKATDLPPGWVERTGEGETFVGSYAQGQDYCPECAAGPRGGKGRKAR